MTWLAVKATATKAWSWLRAVPSWVYAMLGWFVAYLFWNLSRAWKNRAEVQAKQGGARAKLIEDVVKIEATRRSRITKAEETHAAKQEVIKKKEEAIDASSDDLSSLADVINESFKKED